ncbi:MULTISPECIES: hypothetical protein [Nocardiopsis]|uniref:Uncharacterized protein n=1 Tax=Nocardiopsis sinuspersici TaxID=501010 RepID=A0A1V3C368_9ACTN|nr:MULTISPECIES: hypothetical protein [Nocardiopsis]OOC55088.1 hypothetical protein NOSIN_15800 [Nocardiopsis sinuspersici]
MSPRAFEPAEPSLAALGALLDRSLAQIADAARDARTFDRETVRAVSDVWDDNTFPLFRAATGRSGRTRERRARAVLEWMACPGPTRWDWMVEQSAVAGHRIDALVQPSPAPSDQPYRDYRGEVRPACSRWTPQAVADLADDYALGAATVHHLRVERVGTRLCGFLTLGLARSYDPGENASRTPAALDVHLDEVTEVDVDTGAPSVVRLDTTPHGVSVGLGTRGVLRARAASLRLDDSCWHRSGAGRRADARIPPGEDGSLPDHRPRGREVEGSTRGAATFLFRAMTRIRSVHHPREAARVPVGAYCRALKGAGHHILEAGALPPRRRDAAFRSLVTEWLRRGGTDLAPDWKRLLRDVPDAGELLRGVRDELPARGAVPSARVPAREVTGLPEQAELRMVAYTAEHTDGRSHRDASATVHLAVTAQEAGAPWRLRVLDATGPVRLRARTEAFDGTVRVRMDADENGREALVTGDETLTLAARAWSREPPSH